MRGFLKELQARLQAAGLHEQADKMKTVEDQIFDSFADSLNHYTQQVNDSLADTALSSIRHMFSRENLENFQCCAKDTCRVIPNSPRDWLAVHNLILVMACDLSNEADEMLTTLRRWAGDYATGRKKITDTVDPDDTAQIEFLVHRTAYTVAKEIIRAHHTLVKNNCMAADNADLHYDRIVGICEEVFLRRMSNESRGKDRSTRGTGQTHPAEGGGDKETQG